MFHILLNFQQFSFATRAPCGPKDQHTGASKLLIQVETLMGNGLKIQIIPLLGSLLPTGSTQQAQKTQGHYLESDDEPSNLFLRCTFICSISCRANMVKSPDPAAKARKRGT
jgi:hypothetical protein